MMEALKKRAKEVVDIVSKVNIHKDTKSCRKYQTKCRYGFPRYPIWTTLISKPLNVTGEEGKLLKNKYDEVLKDAKDLSFEILGSSVSLSEDVCEKFLLENAFFHQFLLSQ